MTLSTARIEALAWVLVYGGIAVACVGFGLTRAQVGYGWAVVAAGAVVVAAGACCIWLRSRMGAARS